MIRTIFFIVSLFISGNLQSQYFTSGTKIELDWRLVYSLPEKSGTKKIRASVPGAIQLDISQAEKYDPWYNGENLNDYLWMEDHFFTYMSDFRKPDLEPGERVFFYSGGIDYKFDVMLNGTVLLRQEGMFTPVELDLTRYLKDKNQLEVLIYPVSVKRDEPADKRQAAESFKPAMSFSGDGQPILFSSGIWKETYLHVRPASFIKKTLLQDSLSEDMTKVFLDLEISGNNLAGNQLIWKLRNNQGNVVASKVLQPQKDELQLDLVLDNPELWWPHDHGYPYMYISELELRNQDNEMIQVDSKKTGFRRVRLVLNEGAPKQPGEFPQLRGDAPAQIEINGRKIFAKGTNWINPEVFPGIITAERYDKLTNLAVEANFNIIRLSGAGIVNKESFYRQCDEKGLLVWQEFPIASNHYIATPKYMEVLKRESATIIQNLRQHPCVAIWSGGSELFNPGSGMTDQSIVLRTLNNQCLKYDPETPYFHTTPLKGMAHGPYEFRDIQSGTEIYRLMTTKQFTAYPEFGILSPAPVEVLETIIPSNERWPPERGSSWESHYTYHAWGGDIWQMQQMIDDYYGPSNSLEEFVKNGQLIQVAGYKAIYEEARRQKPHCSMALNHSFNEPWPTAANTSLISWLDIRKPAFYGVRDACRPVLASARIEKYKWNAKETFEADLFLLNDSYSVIPPGEMTIRLVADQGEILALKWNYPGSGMNKNVKGPTIRSILPDWETDRFRLILEVTNHPEYNSEYLLLFTGNQAEEK